MSKIRVDPNILHKEADNIKRTGGGINDEGRRAMHSASSAPDIQDFGKKVKAIGREAEARAGRLNSTLSGLSGRLHTKAQAFEAADMASASGFGKTFSLLQAWQEAAGIFAPFLKFGAQMMFGIESYIKYGSLLLRGDFKGLKAAYISDKMTRSFITATFIGISLPWSIKLIDSNSLITDNSPKTFLERSVLTQTRPEGSETILQIERWESNEVHVEKFNWDNKRSIITIEDHIKAYGCLMTAFTMALQDKGEKVDVTDIYKANYELKNENSNLIEDYNRDGHIVLFDLNANDQVVEKATNNKFTSVEEYIPQEIEKQEEFINKMIDEKGSIILHVDRKNNDGHWVLVDKSPAGEFRVRDPMETEVIVFEDYSKFSKDVSYQLNPDRKIKYIE